MLTGLDFGTSNSAIGIIKNREAKLVALENNNTYLPSTLYAFDRCFVSEFVFNQLPEQTKGSYKKDRGRSINLAKNTRIHEGFSPHEPLISFGLSAISDYIESPEEGLFVKSPKSFLGATGLSERQIEFFEDIVTAMMINIKNTAESNIKEELSKVVIGRPVNFQGIDSEQSNLQATSILTRAAKRCGYSEVEFLYEPLAAGIDFESKLTEDKTVLVVDIGGGTSDCSMVNMGPSHHSNKDRKQDFLAHSGERVGGNDLDIALAFTELMPLFGKNSLQKKGIEQPHGPFWTSVCINNIGEQTEFNSLEFVKRIERLQRSAEQPELFQRLLNLQKTKLNHRLVRSAELAKIALSDQNKTNVSLDYIEPQLTKLIDTSEFESAVVKPLNSIKQLIEEAITQAGTNPEIFYITGGSAKSPVFRTLVKEIVPKAKILDGDYYGSVAAGLTKWAGKLWS